MARPTGIPPRRRLARYFDWVVEFNDGSVEFTIGNDTYHVEVTRARKTTSHDGAKSVPGGDEDAG